MITADRLREILLYDPTTGAFVWLIGCNRVPVGSVAGHIRRDGYVTICADGRSYKAHRLAWLYVHGEMPSGDIDHIDGIRSNNALINLRKCSRAENMQNIKLLGGKFPCGVSLSRNGMGFAAKINCNGVRHHLGTYSTPEDAHSAYVEAKRELHRFQPNLMAAA